VAACIGNPCAYSWRSVLRSSQALCPFPNVPEPCLRKISSRRSRARRRPQFAISIASWQPYQSRARARCAPSVASSSSREKLHTSRAARHLLHDADFVPPVAPLWPAVMMGPARCWIPQRPGVGSTKPARLGAVPTFAKRQAGPMRVATCSISSAGWKKSTPDSAATAHKLSPMRLRRSFASEDAWPLSSRHRLRPQATRRLHRR